MVKKNNSGQALLIILLVLSVVLTIILSVVSRSSTDIRITTYQDESARAFGAAEAGVEEIMPNLMQYIPQGPDATVVTGNSGNADFNVNISTPSSGLVYVYPEKLLTGEEATFWFVSRNKYGLLESCYSDESNCLKSNRIDIYFGNGGTNNNDSSTPAVEISVYYDDSYNDPAPNNNLATRNNDLSQVKVMRYTADPNSNRRISNRFGSASSGNYVMGSKSFAFGFLNEIRNNDPIIDICIQNTGCVLMVKIRMLYNTNLTGDEFYPHYVAIEPRVTGNTVLPAQGIKVTSLGSFSESYRNINVFSTYPTIPSIINTSVSSQGGI